MKERLKKSKWISQFWSTFFLPSLWRKVRFCGSLWHQKQRRWMLNKWTGIKSEQFYQGIFWLNYFYQLSVQTKV